MPKLTIGMSVFEDFHGVYFSIQALRLANQDILDDLEFPIIDNSPETPHGNAVKNFMTHIPNGKYIPQTEWVSTASRDLIFRNSNTPYTLSMDSHVLFVEGAIKKLINYYEDNPDTNNLLQGPLLYDDMKNISTHFSPAWRSQMYGTWALDKQGLDPDNKPFEIPMQGLGMFSCRTDAWLGFHRGFKGFGGEEGYIHEKYRKSGYKTLCLPFLRWIHRFQRPDGVKFPLTIENKVRNYYIGWFETGQDVQQITDHFSEHLSNEQLKSLEFEALLELQKHSPKEKPKQEQLELFEEVSLQGSKIDPRTEAVKKAITEMKEKEQVKNPFVMMGPDGNATVDMAGIEEAQKIIDNS